MKDEKPVVSIVIPSFNHEAYVGEAINSALAQKNVTVELIVIDDGSSDDSPKLIAKLLERHGGSNCELLVQKNKGAHAAINRGIGRTHGEFIHILNSDDRLHPDRCARLILSLGDKGQLAISNVSIINSEGRTAPSGHPMRSWYRTAMNLFLTEPSIGFGLLSVNFAVTTSNFLFRRSLLDKTGDFTSEKLCHDWRFLLRALRFTEPVHVPEPLIDYRFHGGNTAPRLVSYQRTEGETALREYLASVCQEAPNNRLAPCPFWWPGFFDVFARTRRSWFANQFISDFLPSLPKTYSF
jgi:glycosyltransferase involved in cell wall biosynthesis